MKKKLLFFILSLAFLQANGQMAVVATGGNSSGSGGTINYTIGQVIYTSVIGTNSYLTQGVQQLYEIRTITGFDEPFLLQLAVYPNPTTNWLQLEVKNIDFSNLSYQLVDLTQRVITNQNITSETSLIAMDQLLAAVYLLKVLDKNKVVKTFKIIKK